MESDVLYMLHFSLVAVVSEFAFRFWIQYLKYPWVLIRLVDPRNSQEARTWLADAFLQQTRPCCRDRGFSALLHEQVQKAEDLMQGGSHWDLLELMSVQKIMNIEVEDNFSRAARTRTATQGTTALFCIHIDVLIIECFLCCIT